jgi:anti-anti-sigma factor
MRSESREVVLSIKEDLVEHNALRFADYLKRIPFQRFDRIVLSLAGVRSIDATGIAVLVRLYSHLMSKKKALVLTGITLPVLTLLHQIGLTEVMTPSLGAPQGSPISAEMLTDSYMPLTQAQMAKH